MLIKFYEYLQLNKTSKRTIQTYYQQVNCFGKYCNYEFNQINLDKYIIKLKKENKKQSSLNSFFSSIRVYCKFANLNLVIPIPKRTKRSEIKFYFTEEDMKNVYKNLPLLSSNYQEKELVIKFMFYTGARPSDLLKLEVKDIDFKNKNIIFRHAKGNKDRIVPFMNNELYLRLKELYENKEGKVFTITYAQLSYLLKQIKKTLNLEGIVEPRTLRISFAKWCLTKGMDISYLKKLMGHSDIKITELYAEPDEKMIKEFCERIRKGE